MNFRIREARIAAKLTQEQLSKMLGIKNTTLSGYESGAHDPKSNTLIEIARICNTTTDFLLGLEPESDIKKEPADMGGPETPEEERFVWLYRQLGDEGVQVVNCYLSLSPSNRRLLFAIAQAIQREQCSPASPDP